MEFTQIFKSQNHRITNADKEFAKQLAFKGIKFPVKIRDFHKIEQKEFCRH